MGRLRFFGQEEVDIRLRTDRSRSPRRLVPRSAARCAGWVCDGVCADCATIRAAGFIATSTLGSSPALDASSAVEVVVEAGGLGAGD
jgi:hypothetical protein